MQRLRTYGSVVVTTILLMVGLASAPAWSQKKGSSAKVTQGKVVKKEWVQLKSEAGKGVLMGGAVGLATAQGKTKSKKWRNAVIGSAVGGATRAAKEGDRKAVAYTVEAAPGQLIRVVTDQTEIRQGDCVVVEEAGGTANVRRVSAVLCDPASRDAVESAREHLEEEATECLEAKKQLLAAETEAQIELILRKVAILCND